MKHTETPWASWNDHVIIPAEHINRKIGGSTNRKEDREDFAHEICRIGRNANHFSADHASANCEFIIRACNSHDQLVAALKETLSEAVGWIDEARGCAPKDLMNHEWYDRALAALAAAGEQS